MGLIILILFAIAVFGLFWGLLQPNDPPRSKKRDSRRNCR